MNPFIKLLLCAHLGLGSMPAFAADEDPDQPGFPLDVKLKGSASAIIQPYLIKFGNGYMISTVGDITQGAILGVYYPNDLPNSVLALSFPFGASVEWNAGIGVGAYYIVDGVVTSVFTPAYTTIYTNTAFPMSWNYVNSGAAITYNQVTFIGALYPNLKQNSSTVDNPRGMQVQPAAKQRLGDALIARKPISLGSVDAHNSSAIRTMDSFRQNLRDYGGNMSKIQTLPALDAGELYQQPASKIDISSQKIVFATSANCKVIAAPAGVACPLASTGGHLNNYSVRSTVSGVSLMQGSNPALLSSSPVGPDLNVFMSAAWIDSKLGTNTQVVLGSAAAVALRLYPTSQPLFENTFNFFQGLTINRVNYSVGITERSAETKVNGYYQGQIGDSTLTLPYSIKQFGASKATRVTLSVTGPVTEQDNDGNSYCKFTTATNQSIAVPLYLAFSGVDGAFRQEQRADCLGSGMDISNTPWSSTMGAAYTGELWLDLIFKLTSRRILTDINGHYWAGSAKASGNIKVNAVWTY